MTNKKSKFLTFFISLIPGAGEMYLGFYKTGASIMVLFFGGYGIFGYLFRPFVCFLPVLWFYSFFHTHNLNNMPDDEFYALEDDYLFHIQPSQLTSLAMKYRKPLAFLLIFMGVGIIWNNVNHILSSIARWFIWSDAVTSFIRYWGNALPQLAAAALIIWLGWRLIQNKKETLSTPPYLADKQVEDKDTVAAAAEK
ncbi:MAG: hypothetical protein HFG65_12620 [Hungatella sp.]|nr:hypothetical protein [Hungatella sp.]